MAFHCFEKHERAGDIVVVVPQGNFGRFADGLEAREVDDGVEVLLLEHGMEADRIEKIYFVQIELASGEFFHTM